MRHPCGGACAVRTPCGCLGFALALSWGHLRRATQRILMALSPYRHAGLHVRLFACRASRRSESCRCQSMIQAWTIEHTSWHSSATIASAVAGGVQQHAWLRWAGTLPAVYACVCACVCVCVCCAACAVLRVCVLCCVCVRLHYLDLCFCRIERTLNVHHALAPTHAWHACVATQQARTAARVHVSAHVRAGPVAWICAPDVPGAGCSSCNVRQRWSHATYFANMSRVVSHTCITIHAFAY